MKKIAVIPALNCEKTIYKVVGGLEGLVDQVIIVDDGSTDQTKRNGHFNGSIVISHGENKGLGAALRTGFKEAIKKGADIIVTLDGDGQHEPKDVKKILDLLIHNHCDMVVGSRLLDKEGWAKFPKTRLLGNRILTFLTNLAVGKKVTTDSQSGYRAMKRAVAKQIRLHSNRMEISSEIIVETARKGFRIKEVPIKPTYEDEISNQNIVFDPLKIISMLFGKFVRRYL